MLFVSLKDKFRNFCHFWSQSRSRVTEKYIQTHAIQTYYCCTLSEIKVVALFFTMVRKQKIITFTGKMNSFPLLYL